jgi:hypothetical protein
MTCGAYICEETSYSRDYPYWLHKERPAYICDKEFAPENYAVSTWLIQRKSLMKNVTPEISPMSVRGLSSLYM